MFEQRKNQRIRLSSSCPIRIGGSGRIHPALIENISTQGLMARCEDESLPIGSMVGCEFTLPGIASLDLPATVVSRVGVMLSVRFQAGPLSAILLERFIAGLLMQGDGTAGLTLL